LERFRNMQAIVIEHFADPSEPGLMTSFLDAEACAAVLRDLGPGFDEGALRAPAIAERYPLEKAGKAYARVESGKVAGRVLLLMD
jgi:NADPH:quinone reductase